MAGIMSAGMGRAAFRLKTPAQCDMVSNQVSYMCHSTDQHSVLRPVKNGLTQQHSSFVSCLTARHHIVECICLCCLQPQ